MPVHEEFNLALGSDGGDGGAAEALWKTSINDVRNRKGRGWPKKSNMSQIRTKLGDWAVWQARTGCYSEAALSSNYSKTLYRKELNCMYFPKLGN